MKVQVDPAVDAPKVPPRVQKPVKKQGQTVKPDLNRIASVGRPWWSEAPEIAHKCLVLIFSPFRFAAMALDMLVSLVFLSFFGVIGLWWLGYISDATVAHFIGSLGNRVLSIIQSSGVL